MIVDVHAHLGRGIDGTPDRLLRDLTAAMVIGPAAEAGVDRTVVFPVTYLADQYPSANREIAAAVAAHPDALIGFARVNPLADDAAGQLAEAVTGMGLRGVKLHRGCDGFPIDHPRVGAIIGCAGELGVPVIFHSGGIVPQPIAWARQHPRTQLVFGSDAPAMHPAVELEKIRVLRLPADVEAAVLGGNAGQLLGL